MSTDAWLIVAGMAITNLSSLVIGLIHITSRLTRIETNLSWVMRNQNKCQPNSENP